MADETPLAEAQPAAPFDPNSAVGKVMIEQAAALGLNIDPAWTNEQLAAAISTLQASAAAAEKAAFDNAKRKVPVRMLKGAFPVQGVKLRKGEIAQVPLPLAKTWIASGVAERADPLPGDE